jgi:hypothetical protein
MSMVMRELSSEIESQLEVDPFLRHPVFDFESLKRNKEPSEVSEGGNFSEDRAPG